MTLLFTIGLFFLSLILIALSLFLTGKMRVRIGSCGKFPGKKESCDKDSSSCDLCSNKKEDDV